MKETILQIVQDYAPVFLVFVMMVIDKIGFGGIFSRFRSDITASFDLNKLTKELERVKGDMLATYDELKDVREEIRKAREAITRVKEGKK